MTSDQPQNASEWQLYKVLQRANLLSYYRTFIAQGGDDVQQLCEAGEEEFLEIMALVGMASKPLHVRRLQKALQEWVANPAAFQEIDSSSSGTIFVTSSPGSNVGFITPVKSETFQVHSNSSGPLVWSQMAGQLNNSTSKSPSPVSQTKHTSPITTILQSKPQGFSAIKLEPAQINSLNSSVSQYIGDFMEAFNAQGTDVTQDKSHSPSPGPTSVIVLNETQIAAIAEAADKLASELPNFEPRSLNMKKQINKDIVAVMKMSEDDPERMDALRKYAAIYGRFDSKRKGEKPMSLHEVSVNEAAAQLCRQRVSLLTRREDLFPLARQVVKQSGYQYSKGHSRSSDLVVPSPSSSKKPRYEALVRTPELIQKFEAEKAKREERLVELTEELIQIKKVQEELKTKFDTLKRNGENKEAKSIESELDKITHRHLLLLNEQSEIMKKQVEADKFLKAGLDDDDQSCSSSPRAENSGDCHDFATLRSQFFSNQIGDVIARGGAIQESLFDEGLRIAQQYGMADFAQEIKQMNNVSEEDQNGDVGENGHSEDSEEHDSPPTNSKRKAIASSKKTVNGNVS